MIESQIDIPMPDGVADCWLYQPSATGHWPGIVMLTDIVGVRPVFQDMAKQLAAHGYVVLLPNIYFRQGRIPLFDHIPSMQNDADRAILRGWADKYTAELQTRDGGAFVDALAAHESVKGKIGIVGYCLTGATAIYTAVARPDKVAAIASYHGVQLATDKPDSPHTKLAQTKARMFFGHATEDQSCPPEMVAKFEAALKAAKSDAISETFPAKHGFAVTGHANHSPEAGERTWKTLLTLFDETLK